MRPAVKRPRRGQRVQVRALKADGHAYRWWTAQVERVRPDRIVIFNRIGDVVEGTERGWRMRHFLRTVFWFDRPYNLVEMYEPSARLRQLYIHIASCPIIYPDTIEYIDYELDVVKRAGEPPRVVDQNEFAVAAKLYDYSPELQEKCWDAVEDALHLIRSWHPSGINRPSGR